jgi:glycosyltransferase involved in cell wall biosynthesis
MRGLRFAVVCLTAESFEELKSETIDMGVFLIPNGTRVVPVQAREAEAGHSPSLILAGSLVPNKGIDVAMIAMVELRRRLGRNCPVLNIYGDGFQEGYLTEMAAVLELNDIVRFHGFKSGILEHCSSADILVVASRWEAGPLVVLEAMSRGMPIVATDVGEVSNMLPDRRYGRVIPSESFTALADAIESLLADIAAGKFDPNLLIERHRSLYSIEKWVGEIEAAYEQILQNNTVPRS